MVTLASATVCSTVTVPSRTTISLCSTSPCFIIAWPFWNVCMCPELTVGQLCGTKVLQAPADWYKSTRNTPREMNYKLLLTGTKVLEICRQMSRTRRAPQKGSSRSSSPDSQNVFVRPKSRMLPPLLPSQHLQRPPAQVAPVFVVLLYRIPTNTGPHSLSLVMRVCSSCFRRASCARHWSWCVCVCLWCCRSSSLQALPA